MPTTESHDRSDRRAQLVGFGLRGFPADLKNRIRKQADETETNMNDLMVAALAREFRVRFEPSDRPSTGGGDSDQVVLYMPQRLHDKIKRRALDERTSGRRVVLDVLLDAFPA